MSVIDRLLIRGVRSFDDKGVNVIQFYTPLTLIVGQNGSGKTTIIECLKYATTGDMPPNSKGGAFAHDPQLANEKQVMAQVKFRFYNVNGKRNTVTRNFQVTLKKGQTGLTLKSLEQTISAQDEDETGSKRRHNLSSRCADLDEEVPRQLGVSKPILENVIFCHQEESSWPLSEPGVLKKKFDDIFEATKYTKALDHMKVLRKDRANEIKLDKERLQSLKTDSERAEKMRKNLEALTVQVEEKTALARQHDLQIKKTTDEMKVFFESAVQYDRTLNEVRTLQQRFDMIQENLASLYDNMTPLEESDDEIRRKRSSFQADLDTFDEQRRSKKRQLSNLEEEMLDLRQRQSRRSREEGQLLAEKEALDAAKRQRTVLVRELSSVHALTLPECVGSEDQEAQEFGERLKSLLRVEKTKLDKIKRELRTKEEALMGKLQQLTSEKAVTERSLTDLTASRQASQMKIDRMRKESQLDTTDPESLAVANEQLQAEKESVDAQLSHARQSKYDQKILQAETKMKDIEERQEALNTELAEVNGQSEIRARLDIGRKSLEKQSAATKTLETNMRSEFERIVGTALKYETAESHINQVMAEYESNVTVADRRAQAAQRNVQECDVKITIEREKIANLQSRAKEIEESAERLLEGQDYDELIAGFSNDRAERAHELAFMQQSNGYLQRQLDKAKSHQMCPTCHREFDETELIPFETLIKKQMQSLPEKQKSLDREIEQLDQRLDYLRALGPKLEECKRIRRDDLPASEASIGTLRTELTQLRGRYDDANAQLAEARKSIEDLGIIKRYSIDIVRMNRDISELSREVQGLERSLASTGFSRSVEDIQSELRELADEYKSVKKQVHSLQTEKEKKGTALNVSMMASTRLEARVKELEIQLRDRQTAERHLEEQEQELRTLKASIQAAHERDNALHRPIEDLEDQLTKLRAELSDAEATGQRSTSLLQSSLTRLESINDDINRLTRNDPMSRLTSMTDNLRALENEVKAQEDRVASVRQALATMEHEYSQRNSVQRNLDDNLRYREMQKSAQSVSQEIELYDVVQARSNKQNFDTKYEASKILLNKKTAEHARLSGEISTLKAQLQRYEEELHDDFAGIQEKYVEQLIKVKTSEVANKDLETYSKALDSAIMGFHSLKMNEINTTIADLWQRTYQGTDIDSIGIKSDAESAKGNRSYNYRVVMVKDDVEMDMRGRCSAGQKVLASIIIRLALAESFSTNCGVLALDEPTTNLDRENIVALAGAIANIIKERRRQVGFQLIVITHDEQFLNALGKTEFTDYYWRVTRDEKARSIIERQRVNNN